MMIGQLGWEKIDLAELANIWRLCSLEEASVVLLNKHIEKIPKDARSRMKRLVKKEKDHNS